MNRKWLAVLFLSCVAASCLLFACKKSPGPVFAITHVTVIDMTGAPPAPDQTVLLEKGKIIALGPAEAIAVPYGAQVLSARGKYLIPGLSDMHLHLTGAGEPGGSREFFLPLLIANGVTTVRDMGGYLDSLIPLRKEIEEGKRVGPRIVFAGPYLDGAPPSFEPSFVVSNRVQAAEDVRALIARGVDFIKVQSRLSREAYFAIAETCKREHIRFVGHVPDRVTAWEAADAGQNSIEHLTCVLRACSSDEAKLVREQFRAPGKKQTAALSKERQLAFERDLLATFSEKKAAELLVEFREKQTWQVPTLILLKNDAFPASTMDLTNDARVKYVPRKFLESRMTGHAEQMKGVSAEEAALRKALLEKSLHIVGEMQKRGVKILAGTDSAAPFVFPGSSLHEELELLVKAGLRPIEALEAATRSAAEFLGKLDSQGTIEKGKVADLVLLDANPLVEIQNTQKIRAVFLRGKLFDRAALDALLVEEEKFAAAH